MWSVLGPVCPINLLTKRIFAKVPRAITASFPLREPYELNSRGVNLNIKQLSRVLREGKVLRMLQEHQSNSNHMKAMAEASAVSFYKVLASSPTSFYQPMCPVWATTTALWCLGGHTTRLSATPLMVITINIHKIRMAHQLAANIESSNKRGSINLKSMREMWGEVGPWDFFPWSLYNHLTDQQTNSHNWQMTIVNNWAHKRQGYTVVSLSCTFVIHWLKTVKILHTVAIVHVPICDFPFHLIQCAASMAAVMLGTKISWSVYLWVHTYFRHYYSTAVLHW